MDGITLLLLFILLGVILLILILIPTESELNKLKNTVIQEDVEENTKEEIIITKFKQDIQLSIILAHYK